MAQNISTATQCEIVFRWMSQNHISDVKIGSGNGLVPLGNKPLPEPMLTQIYIDICLHLAPPNEPTGSNKVSRVMLQGPIKRSYLIFSYFLFS